MAGYIEMFNLGKTYDTPNGPAVIVEEFDLNMGKGEYVCLLGHSGCGKSTVLTMVAGLNEITLGEGPEDDQHDARCEVGERALQGQAYRKAGGAEQCDQRGGVDTQLAEGGDDDKQQ